MKLINIRIGKKRGGRARGRCGKKGTYRDKQPTVMHSAELVAAHRLNKLFELHPSHK